MTLDELRGTYRCWAIGAGRDGYLAIRRDNVFLSELDAHPRVFALVAPDITELAALLAEQTRLDAQLN